MRRHALQITTSHFKGMGGPFGRGHALACRCCRNTMTPKTLAQSSGYHITTNPIASTMCLAHQLAPSRLLYVEYATAPTMISVIRGSAASHDLTSRKARRERRAMKSSTVRQYSCCALVCVVKHG